MEEALRSNYETLKQKSRYSCWAQLAQACRDQAILVPSYRTFCRAVLQSAQADQILKRQGQRAAYQAQTFYWELELKTPRHGDRPFEIAHIDHTELDLETVCSATGRPLGRPWLTLLTDAFSRRVLAFYLTFDPPSYRSCMMALRECVRRHARFPQTLVMDGGKEFQSVYFETLLARYECTKKCRPPAEARFGSVSERLFGTANTQFLYNLAGNSQITRDVRQVTDKVDPKHHAAWSLPELHRCLAEYFYDLYDTIQHPALGQTPRDAFEQGFVRAGVRAHRLIAYDLNFLMATLPTTAKGTAKVLANRGVKVNYLYYWCEAFRDPRLHQKQVPVRLDPFDVGTMYAFVNKEWLPCHSQYYAVFRGRSEREIMLASKELQRVRQRHSQQFHVTARRLADFLQSVYAQERLYIQRLADRELKEIRAGSAEAAISFSLTSTPTDNLRGYCSSESSSDDMTQIDPYEEF